MGAAPLQNVRLVEFDGMGPVPLAGRMLAGMGADVVRIARAGSADRPGSAALLDNRPVVRLDLKSAEGIEAARSLIAEADGLIEGFRPGVMERLGLGPEPCHAANPALVYVRLTGWGQDGPLAQAAGHDLNYLALSGVLHAIGPADRPPPPPLNLIGDYGGGSAMAVIAMLGGLMQARESGRGRAIDVAMVDGIAALASTIHSLRNAGRWSDARGDNLLDGAAPFYRCYRCADGGHVAVGALEPQFFAALLDGLGIARDRWVQRDGAGWPDMEREFAARFASQPRDAWAALFADSDACVTPVLTMAEATRHPHNLSRGIFAGAMPVPVPPFGDDDADARPAAEEATAVVQRWQTAARR